MNNDNYGYVYFAECHDMSGLVKIGYTTQQPLDRLNSLSTGTSIPSKFSLIASLYCKNPKSLEIKIHEALNKFRIEGKEFFRIKSNEAISISEKLYIEHENSDQTDPLIKLSINEFLSSKHPSEFMNYIPMNNNDFIELIESFEKENKQLIEPMIYKVGDQFDSKSNPKHFMEAVWSIAEKLSLKRTGDYMWLGLFLLALQIRNMNEICNTHIKQSEFYDKKLDDFEKRISNLTESHGVSGNQDRS